jgi:hypothetical protein
VAILRALGLAATVAIGIPRLPADGLRDLDARFGGPTLVFPPGQEPTAPPEEGEPAAEPRPVEAPPASAGPTLALLGWSLLSPGAPPSGLGHAAAHLAAARRHLGLDLAGVAARRLGPEELQNLEFRLTFRDPRLLREFFLQGADFLEDFEALAGGGPGVAAGPAPAPGYAAAQAELMAALAEGGGAARLPGRAREALRSYDEAVQQELVGPLERWALQHADTVVRSAGVELAAAGGMLHRMSPLLRDLQSRHWERARQAGAGPIPEVVLAQYLALAGRFGGLLRDLCRWRGA